MKNRGKCSLISGIPQLHFKPEQNKQLVFDQFFLRDNIGQLVAKPQDIDSFF